MVSSDSQCMDLLKNWRTQIKFVRRIKKMAITTLPDALQKKTSLRKTTQQETSNIPKSNLRFAELLPKSYIRVHTVDAEWYFVKSYPRTFKGLSGVKNPKYLTFLYFLM